jgi:hypothetical protein
VERLVPRLEAATVDTATSVEDDTDEADASESETHVGERDTNEHERDGSPITPDRGTGSSTPGGAQGLF